MRNIHNNVANWASILDDNTRLQAEKSARLPIVAGHIALMPDAHYGMGATVGSVIPTTNALIPAAVGVDLGCGVIAVETDLTANMLPDDLNKLQRDIASVVPAGVGQGHRARKDGSNQQHRAIKRMDRLVGMSDAPELDARLMTKAVEQFGSLGSGNHFVEICLDENDTVWVLLHSGSRGVGNELAMKHIECAKGVVKEYHEGVLEDPDLAYLVEGTREFDEYVKAMLWAQSYAAGNRNEMMDAVLPVLFKHTNVGHEVSRINNHHNYTVREQHMGRDIWVTRKGAIRAGKGDFGVIPGSMGTRSYIVSGLGNPLSYESCSHGAGRVLSRTQARKKLDADTFIKSMEGKAWDDRRARETKRGALIEEDPRAYKNIDTVMEDQRDLVEVVHTLRQVVNYKG